LKKNKQNYDLVLVHGLWQYAGFATFKALKNSNIPYCIYPRSMLDPYFNKFKWKFLKKLLYWFIREKKVIEGAHKLLFTSQEELNNSFAFGSYQANKVVIPFGIPSTNVKAKHKDYVLYIGRLHRKKGIPLLLNAMNDFPKVLNIVAGPMDEFGEKMKKLSGKNVNWLGMVFGDKKWKLISEADALILPSHQENFGIVVAEALACGVPVLISNKVNIWKEVLEENAGFVEDDTLEGTKALLRKWYSLSNKEKDKMRINAKKCFNKHFNIEN
jgi:glycosyltransferase involved in cell wall biosynthesis